MANYNHSLDLMSLIGAQMVNLKVRPRREGESEEEYAKVPVLQYAAIPVAPNDIQVKPDNTENEEYRNYSGFRAYLAFNEFDAYHDSNLVKRARTRLMQSGTPETPYNVPCRELKPRYRVEFRDNARKRYCAQIKAAHPEWASLEDQGVNLPPGTERNELTRAIDRKFPYSIGNGYLIEPKKSNPSVAPVAQSVSGYTTPAPVFQDPTPLPEGYDNPDTDLPF